MLRLNSKNGIFSMGKETTILISLISTSKRNFLTTPTKHADLVSFIFLNKPFSKYLKNYGCIQLYEL